MDVPYPLFKLLVEEEFEGLECHCALNADQTVRLGFRLNDPARTPYQIPSLDFQAGSYRGLSMLIIDLRNQLDARSAIADLRLSA